MPDFATLRFDHRILCVKDDGGAFEDFVREYLQRKHGDDLVRSLARGRDGAIDLINPDGPIQDVAECKFISAEAKDGPVARWGKVKDNLKRNLPDAARGKGGAAIPYRPWLRSNGPVERYRFCTSDLMGAPDNRNTLRQSIEGFFEEIAKDHPELAHLADLSVEVLYWDDFIADASKFPPLFYRWFGGLPAGVNEIAHGFGASEQSFKRFLDSKALPYFSRAAHAEQTGRVAARDEAALAAALVRAKNSPALVISGPGGIGKTRLAVELCARLNDMGWFPLRMERNANPEAIGAIAQSYSAAARLVFFIDYAEAFPALEGVAEMLRRLGEDVRHQVRLIASCRHSGLQRVTDALTDLEPETLSLDSDEARPEGYDAWVVDSILAHFKVPDAAQIAPLCVGLPVLAAFAGFLYRHKPANFREQFGNLAGVTDFTIWADRRIELITNRRPDRDAAERALAEIALRLPMPLGEAQALRAGPGDHAALLDILQADHWIEPEAQGLAAAHDVFADALAARHVFGMKGLAGDRLGRLLAEALDEGRLERALVAVNRLAAHPGFIDIDGLALVRALLDRNRAAALEGALPLVFSRLLTPPQAIALLAGEPELRDRLAADPAAHGRVSWLAEWTARKGPDQPSPELAQKALAGPVAAAAGFAHSSNMVLRRAYVFDPPRYRDAALARIRSEPAAPQTHYLLAAMLRAGTPPAELADDLTAWLTAGRNWPKASFVYQSWLDAGGELDLVREPVRAWLEEHRTLAEAGFVYTSWLNAEGGIDLVHEPIRAWLAKHRTLAEARFVYKSWLDAKGEPDLVREPIRAWLAQHSTLAEAGFVYQSWLDAGGGPDLVREPVRAWLEVHRTLPEAQFVYKGWLDAGGGPDLVREPVRAWLAQHSTLAEAGFVYQSWLDAKGEPDLVREPIRTWLEEHRTLPEAKYVYTSWLQATGDHVAIADPVGAWLAENSEDEELDFVVRAWLESGGPTAPVIGPAIAWLRLNWRLQRAVYITKILSQIDDLPLEAVILIAGWARMYADDEDAIYRVSRVSRYLRMSGVYDDGLLRDAILGSAWVVLAARDPTDGWRGKHDRTTVALLLAHLSSGLGLTNPQGSHVARLFAGIVKSGGVFHPGCGLHFAPEFLMELRICLDAGFLDSATDAAGIDAFLGWCREEGIHLDVPGLLG